MTTAIDWATYQAKFAAACDALDSGDKLLALRSCLQAKLIALGMGGQVSASGASVNLLIQEADNLRSQIVEYFIEKAKLGNNGRFIKTGMKNAGRGFNAGIELGGSGESGGVLHD